MDATVRAVLDGIAYRMSFPGEKYAKVIKAANVKPE
jgi:hypothetical protein